VGLSLYFEGFISDKENNWISVVANFLLLFA
jgi:hypothetical protein